MMTTTIEKVKKGEYFRYPGKQRVYVRGVYIHKGDVYESHRFYDVNHFIYMKKGTIIEIGFDF